MLHAPATPFVDLSPGKTLQYVMGHSDVRVTLNVYTHVSYDRAAEQMAKIIDFMGTVMPEQQRKSG